ncbi:MAG: hypothetical protein HY816_16400 [Candidatus Wallbacteria bacterium]|nr:hypothetical protein [Candidatus Wallbacteria bacterium]
MSFEIYGVPKCPECREELAAKSLTVECGSCGHQIRPERRCGRPWSMGCVGAIALMLLVLGAYADHESSRMHSRMRAGVTARLQELRERNGLLSQQLFAARQALRHTEARERCGLARIEMLREKLIELARQRDEAIRSADQAAVEGEDLLGALDDEDARLQLDIEFLEDLAVRHPDDAEIRIRLASAYSELDASDYSSKMLEHARRALDIDPRLYPRVRRFLGASGGSDELDGLIARLLERAGDRPLTADESRRFSEDVDRMVHESVGR